MILVDSSVWIDYFNNRSTRETDFLDGALQSDVICLGDIIIAEVLQGFSKDGDYRTAKSLLTTLPIYQILTPARAIRAADNFRRLRKKGVTIRKSVDIWIATFCIDEKISLLFSDRDFVPFADHLKLQSPLEYT